MDGLSHARCVQPVKVKKDMQPRPCPSILVGDARHCVRVVGARMNKLIVHFFIQIGTESEKGHSKITVEQWKAGCRAPLSYRGLWEQAEGAR